METYHILILDDEFRLRQELTEFLTDEGYECFEAETPSQALNIVQNNRIDIALVDVNLPEKDGIAFLKEIKDIDEDIEVLMITGQGDMELAIKSMRYGASDFFNKPIQPDEVIQAIERCKRFLNLTRRCNHLQDSYNLLFRELQENLGLPLIGNSKAIQKLKKEIELAAKHPETAVLISGESGTGKELVARSIHHLSERKIFNFYAVNCAAIPENLFESEFFGYNKGAFTGASSDKAGWFEIADKGTLFLDEIGDMQPYMQAKLLRVTEDGVIRRLGSNKDKQVNVRIISATNKDIGKQLDNGEFRSDLYHRLNTIEIKISPLREHSQDIPVLVEHFVRCFAEKTGKEIPQIESALLEKLIQYPYQGNVRELKNMLERAVIICDGSKLTHKHFCFSTTQILPDDMKSEKKHFLNLDLLEQDAIKTALKQTNNNKLQAAKLLNISWQSLERRLKKYHL